MTNSVEQTQAAEEALKKGADAARPTGEGATMPDLEAWKKAQEEMKRQWREDNPPQ